MKNIIVSGSVTVLLVAMLSTACPQTGTHSTQSPRQLDTILNGQWFLQPVLASDTAAGKFPSITFNVAKGTFTGNTGCNEMSGTFKRTDTSLVINEQIALTKMVCPGFNEAAFLKTLRNTNRFKQEDGMLVLMFDQTILSRWTRKPYRAPMSKGT